MPRKIRDLVVTLAALFVLFTMLLSISPQLRDRTAEFTGGSSSQQWGASGGALGQTAESVFAIASGYAADNVYLFAFLVVATVLFVLMLRT